MATYGNWSGWGTPQVWHSVSIYDKKSTVYSLSVQYRYRQSIDGNTTQFQFDHGTFTQHLRGWGMAGHAVWVTVKIGNQQFNCKTGMIFGNPPNSFNIPMGQILTVQHAGDGSFPYALQISAQTDSSDVCGPHTNGFINAEQGLVTIPKIPRASSISLSKGTIDIGQSVTISLNRASSAFTHEIYYSYYDSGWQKIASKIQTSTGWTVPMSFCSKVTDSTSTYVTIRVDTYQGSTKLGESQARLNLNVPGSIVPSISAVNVWDTAKVGNSTYAGILGAYLQGRSVPHVQIKANGSYGSWIKDASTTIGGLTHYGTETNCGIISATGKVTITCVVTDSRGRKSAPKQTTINVLPYTAPVIHSFTVQRSDAKGGVNDEGANVHITYGYTIFALNNKNTANVQLQYFNGKSWVNLEKSKGNPNFQEGFTKKDGSFISDGRFSVDNSYTFRIIVQDRFAQSVATQAIHPSYTLINFGAGGRSIAFGQLSHDAGHFEIGMPTSVNKPMYFNDLAEFVQNAQCDRNLSVRGTVNGVRIDKSMWSAVPYSGGFRTYDGESALRVGRVNQVVNIRGEITATANHANYGEDQLLVGTIPAGFRPDSLVTFVCQGSMANIFIVKIHPDGKIYIDRYRATNANGGTFRDMIPRGAWLPIHGTYLIR